MSSGIVKEPFIILVREKRSQGKRVQLSQQDWFTDSATPRFPRELVHDSSVSGIPLGSAPNVTVVISFTVSAGLPYPGLRVEEDPWLLQA
jgi:hypothetical protein